MKGLFQILTFFVLFAVTSATGLNAQANDPIVSDIEIEFVDIRNVSDEAILARLQVREGMPFNQNLVDRSVRSLYNTRLFDFIEARTEDMAGGQVRVIFTVQARYKIGKIAIEGNDRLKTRRLRREVNSRVGQSLDERRIRRDADKILTFYREKGYTEARVDYSIDRNPTNGQGVVTFLINEGQKLKIDEVTYVGNTAFSARALKKQMETRKRWFLSWLTGSGRFDEAKFQEDLERLRTLYLNAGYLDVSIPESNVTLDYPSAGEIDITIRIDEGRQYRVGDIRFEGNTVFPTPLLYASLGLLPGDVFSPEDLDKDVERISNIYGAVGYLETSVRPERRANIGTGAIDLIYNVRESDKFEVESILIEGNTKTKSIVVIRELALSPGRVFNMVYMKNSEAILRNTRFFDEVQLSPESTNIPGKKNLKVRLKEGRTGNFQFGAGFSSLESAVVFFEISQSNFDLFKFRSPFMQGDGQKFRFKGSVGSSSNEVVLAFEEPWLFERRLAFGFELFRRETDFNSSTYNELRTGVELYLRKRLFGLINGQVAYRYEIVDLQDVTAVAPELIRTEAESSPRSISKVTFTLWRDTRNDLIFTTRGSRISLATTFAGVGGDTEYIKVEGRSAFFLPTFEFGDQVLSILGRVGSLWEYSDQAVPFFDRFYLGGPDSVRGFDYREVGPVDSREPVGGNSYGFGSLEYSIKVADPLRLAIFYDWGFVNVDDFDFSPSTYNDNWGIGIRLLVLGNPLRLDFGIPITTTQILDENGNVISDNDDGSQFHFSFGTRF
ncbi:outer membrane protein assembly factor BamA [Puniceicoccales bacterium CK1056]|uniref:Outer membrane protein assembly factor BamA n=1 Tax=Oceanipulchritudo coccoides TaxID=2706888 RepID=A0A6B2M028_9BACT|nr:outer membrane protein assembly factor BamA [Oceanipulchritudo coccoides]NDV61377.1 outer membrane protein assembly factor BamA [Oceanipulchritudo coccoides]